MTTPLSSNREFPICRSGSLALDQHQLNGLAINPAYAGSQDALNVGIHSRVQWTGFDGAPRTTTLSVHTPLKNKKVNLGLVVMGD